MSFLERMDQSIRRSPVWRSLFRQPYPNDERSRAYAVIGLASRDISRRL